MAISSCERCGFDTGDPESGRHFDEGYCFRAVYLAAIETAKEKIAKVAEDVAHEYACGGSPESERLSEAFSKFADHIINERRYTPIFYWVRVYNEEGKPVETHELGRLTEQQARATVIHSFLSFLYKTKGRVELFDFDPDDEDAKPIQFWTA